MPTRVSAKTCTLKFAWERSIPAGQSAQDAFTFFTSAPRVHSYAEATACDVERFKRFFHGMLAEGVYLAPSAFEAGFVSAAHTDADIDATVAAADRVFRRI